MDAGIQVAVISSSKCQAVHYRMKSLGIEQVYLGVDDKLPCLQMICQSLGITLGETAYMGDDLPDLPVLKAVAFPCAPADAAKEVLKVVQYVSEKNGGHGAVRQVCDMLLNTR